MALTQEELNLVKQLKAEGKTPQEIAGAIGGIRTGQPSSISIQEPEKAKAFSKLSEKFAIPTIGNVAQEAKNVATGFGKGIVEGGTSLVQGLNTLGTGFQAAISPTETFGSLKQKQEDMGSVFSGSRAEAVNQQLESQNQGESVGKGLAFLAEVFTPVGSRKAVTTAVDKGSEILSGVPKGALNSFDNLVDQASKIPDDLVEGGVRVKDQVLERLSGLDDKTKTALERTPKETFQEFVKLGQNAMKDDKVITPLEKVGNDVIDALGKVRNKLQQIGSQKSGLIKIPEPFKGNGIKDFRGNLQSFLNSRTLIENDKPVVKKIVSEFKKLGNTPTKGQVDKFIDYAQDQLYSGSSNLVQQMSDKTVGAMRQLIGELNTNLVKQLPEQYGKLNSQYAKLLKFTNEVNKRLGKEGSSAGSFVKRIFSPSDARTKAVFDQLEKLTGQDFSRDARLAKFIMESLGDTRASNILEQIPTSAKGVIDRGIGFAIDKLSDPLKAAEKFIDRTAR